MKVKSTYFHFGDQLKTTLSQYVDQIFEVIESIPWQSSFSITSLGKRYDHQSGYNRAFCEKFCNRGWEYQPVLQEQPKLIGDLLRAVDSTS